MHPPPRPPRPIVAALDQAFFFLVVFGLTYVAMAVVGWDHLAFSAYAVVVLGCLPAVVASAVFAAQLSHLQTPPVEPRDRHQLREIRPQRPPEERQRRAA
jgi:hypothetical protein